MKRFYVTCVSILLSSSIAIGAGFQLNLQGVRQLAMGGSGTAYPWDISVIFYNPACISDMDGWQAYASLIVLMPNVQYTSGTYSTRTQAQVFYPFNVYVGGPLKSNKRIGIGLGIYTPFGSGIKWDNDWTGRYVTTSSNLEAIYFQPTASYKINDIFSVGAGLIYAYGNVDVQSAIPVQSQQGGTYPASELSGNANGFGYNIGLHAKPLKWLQLGLTYRSSVEMKVSNGNASFTDIPASIADMFPAGTKFNTSLPLPQVISFGVAVNATEKLVIQADVNYVGWNVIDSLKFDFTNHTQLLTDDHTPRHYQNTLAVRLGVHYQLTDKWALMAGGAYDPTPVTDGFVSPDLPDANRTVLTGGISFKLNHKLNIMGAFEYVTTAKRDASFDYAGLTGTYQTKALSPCIGASYNF